MLEDLDRVAWAELTHADGAADDVPELLRGLANGDPEAPGQLAGTIVCDGTVFEATRFAVPFLIEVLDAPGADVRAVLGLLVAIAGGTSFLAVHGALLVELGQDARELHAQEERELVWVAAAREAVAAGLPAYLRLLATAPDEAVRVSVVLTLSAVGATGDSTAALRAAAAADVSPLVRASAVLALALRSRHDPTHLTDPAPLPRVVAAMFAQDAHVLERDAPAALGDVARLPCDIAEPLAWIIGGAGLAWPVQVRLLTAWLGHPDAEMRAAAAYAASVPLLAWRPAAPALAPVLADALSDPDATVRRWAASRLRVAGRAAGAAADALWALLERDPSCTPALEALVWLEDPRADTLLAGRLAGDVDQPVDGSAFANLMALESAAVQRRPASVGYERAVSEFYEGLRPAPGDCPADLAQLRRDLDRQAAQRMVAGLGPWATACRTAVVGAVRRRPPGQDRDRLVRAAVRMQVDPGELVPFLRAQLPACPATSADALGGFGPAAAAAQPDLTALLEHEESEVRLAAAAAILRIGGPPDGPLAAAHGEVAITAPGCRRAVAVLAWPARPRPSSPHCCGRCSPTGSRRCRPPSPTAEPTSPCGPPWHTGTSPATPPAPSRRCCGSPCPARGVWKPCGAWR